MLSYLLCSSEVISIKSNNDISIQSNKKITPEKGVLFRNSHKRRNKLYEEPRARSLPSPRNLRISTNNAQSRKQLKIHTASLLHHRRELFQLIAQTAQIQIDVRSVPLHREQLHITPCPFPHLHLPSKIPGINPRHGESISQPRVVIPHHRRV